MQLKTLTNKDFQYCLRKYKNGGLIVYKVNVNIVKGIDDNVSFNNFLNLYVHHIYQSHLLKTVGGNSLNKVFYFFKCGFVSCLFVLLSGMLKTKIGISF